MARDDVDDDDACIPSTFVTSESWHSSARDFWQNIATGGIECAGCSRAIKASVIPWCNILRVSRLDCHFLRSICSPMKTRERTNSCLCYKTRSWAKVGQPRRMSEHLYQDQIPRQDGRLRDSIPPTHEGLSRNVAKPTMKPLNTVIENLSASSVRTSGPRA